jgi:hypothetical protein
MATEGADLTAPFQLLHEQEMALPSWIQAPISLDRNAGRVSRSDLCRAAEAAGL